MYFDCGSCTESRTLVKSIADECFKVPKIMVQAKSAQYICIKFLKKLKYLLKTKI